MGASQEVTKSDVEGTGTPEVAPQATVPVTAADRTDWAPRPDPALDTPASPTGHNVVIRELPVRVTRTSSPTRDTDTIEITESFTGAVNKIEGKLHDYAKANGARVEEISSRLSATGTISRIWNRSSIAEWLRRTFPAHTFDITRDENKVCQVRVTQGFFSPGITVTVTPYRGGAQEARAIERELEKQAPTAESTSHVTHQAERAVEKGNSPSRPAEVVLPDLIQTLEKRVASHNKVQSWIEDMREEDRRSMAARAKKLGLSSSAHERDIEIIEQLRDLIVRDLKTLPEQARTVDIQAQRDGTFSVMTRAYTIIVPDSVRRTGDWVNRFWNHEGLGPTCALLGTAGVILGPIAFPAGLGEIGSLAGFGFGFLPPLFLGAYSALQSKLAGLALLRDLLRCREPGSLGDIVESLREDGFDCDIHIGKRDKRGWRVNLEVTYKPKGKIEKLISDI